ADLLPRAPSVVPQLLSLLRQENLSWHTMSQRIATDLVLSAEVLRQASNAAYASAHESSRPSNLDQALARLGSDDLRAVIARVVLRPLFANDAGLAAHSAVRAWEHAERQAQHGARIAASHGLDRLDAYLAALVHGGSWAMLLRAIDRILAMQTALPSAPAGPAFEWPFGLPFARQMLQRKDYLFGRVVAGWHLTPALTALGTEAAHAPLADTRSPLGPVLVQAEQRAAADAMALQRAAGAIHAAMASA
ncbi:MAG: HDOD domain-containing protein, partial [Burkholderiaceae bacterium]